MAIMNKIRASIVGLVLVGASLGNSAWAAPRESGFGLGLEVGPNIYGLEVSAAVQVSRFFSLRGQINVLSNEILKQEINLATNHLSSFIPAGEGIFTRDTITGLAKATRFNLDSYSAILDIHPFGGSFRISGGYSYGMMRGVNLSMTGQDFVQNPEIQNVITSLIDDITPVARTTVQSYIDDGFSFLTGINLGSYQGVTLDGLKAHILAEVTTDNIRTEVSNVISTNFNSVSAGINIDPWIPYVGIGWTGPIVGRIGMFFNVGCFLPTKNQLSAYFNYELTGTPSLSYDYAALVNDYIRDTVIANGGTDPGEVITSGSVDYSTAFDEVTNALDSFKQNLPDSFQNLVDIGLPVIPLPVVSIGLTVRFF